MHTAGYFLISTLSASENAEESKKRDRHQRYADGPARPINALPVAERYPPSDRVKISPPRARDANDKSFFLSFAVLPLVFLREISLPEEAGQKRVARFFLSIQLLDSIQMLGQRTVRR